MPINQTFNINTGNAYAGQEYGLRTAMDIRTVVDARETAATACQMGLAAVAVAGTDRGVQGLAGASTAGDRCYGIIVRQVNHEAANIPSTDGIMGLNEGDVLGLMVDGAIMVELGAAVTRDQTIGQRADGTWGPAAAFINVVALQAGAAGDVVPAHIFSVAAPAAAPVALKAK